MWNATLSSPPLKMMTTWFILLGALGATDSAPSSFDPAQALRTPDDSELDTEADRQEIESAVEDAEDPLETAQAHLALANWWLSVEAARPATRWILDMEDEADRRSIADAGRNGNEQLAKARDAMKQAAKARTADEKQRSRELRQAADTLDAFAEIFRHAELPAESEADRETWRKAGRGLAVARESRNTEVASAALLWQAFALEQAGRRDRALESLPDTLAKPDHLPYGLMSRLLRCRLMAEAGQTAAATTLLARLDPQIKDWMTNQRQERNKARRLIGLVQYQVVTRWMSQLKSATQPAAAEPLQSILDAVERSFSEVKNPEVYYMDTAIPLGIAPAKPETPSPATQTAPEEAGLTITWPVRA